VYPLEDLLVAQAIPGFLLAVGWTAMYEVYHEEGSYYVSLLQEILGTEDLFPYFVISALLMAFPLGMIVDGIRQMVGEVWLRLPTRCRRPTPAGPPAVLLEAAAASAADRYLLYRHLRAVVLTPAKAAGNLAVVLLVLLVWFAVRMYRVQGWHVFSWAFILGTLLIGLALTALLVDRYRREMKGFCELTQEPALPAPHTRCAGGGAASPEDDRIPPIS
jgi:hypothetical protein